MFAEMGTVNPVVVTPAGARTRLADIARGFAESFTMGTGQFCTKPGLLLAPAGSDAARQVAAALRELPVGWLLTAGGAFVIFLGILSYPFWHNAISGKQIRP